MAEEYYAILNDKTAAVFKLS